MTDYRASCARMADELDYYRQLLMDDRRETHALAAEARAAMSQPEPEEAANPWKDALIDALVCAFLLNEENQSDPRRALHDLISWEVQLARDPLISPPVHPAPVPMSERLPGPEDCDAEGRCWTTKYDPSLVYSPIWQMTELPRTNTYLWRNVTYWLPAHALPTPGDNQQ